MPTSDTIADLAQVLGQLAALPAQARDEKEVARIALALARQLTGLDSGALAVAGAATRPEVLYNDGVAPRYLQYLTEQYMNLPGARIIATGVPHVVADVREDPEYARMLDRYEEAGIRGMILFPQRQAVGGAPIGAIIPGYPAETELFGMMGLYHSEPIEVSPEVLMLTNVLAEEVALVLCNFRLFREREHFKEEAVLEKSQKVIGTLTAGIAHDLNNVLGAVLSVTQLLPRRPEDQQELLDQLSAATVHASRLTRSLLDMSRVSQSEVKKGRCELVSAAGQAVDMVRASSHPNTKIEVVSDAVAIQVDVDPMAVSRILLNLLLNAIEAVGMKADGRITVRIRAMQDVCRVEVDDNGPGIAPERVEHIFEPYASFGKPHGTGVGLTAARGLAERAGGNLFLLHRPGPGACFVVDLPCARSTTREDLEEEATAETAEGDLQSVKGSPGNCILLAEDEPVQRRHFAEALRDAGYEVVEAVTGGEARRLLERMRFAALVLDQRMPEMTGFELLECLRRQGIRVPALMVTGFSIDPNALQSLENVTIISKPITGQALVRYVATALAVDGDERMSAS